MNSKAKGDIGESYVLYEFIRRGIRVSIPFGDNARYDLVAEFNGKLNRIQVKYCDQLTANDSVVLPCASSRNHTTNKRYTTYQNDVDYFAFYIPAWNTAILVPIEVIGDKKSFLVRKTPPKKEFTNVHILSDYAFDKILDVTVNS